MFFHLFMIIFPYFRNHASSPSDIESRWRPRSKWRIPPVESVERPYMMQRKFSLGDRSVFIHYLSLISAIYSSHHYSSHRKNGGNRTHSRDYALLVIFSIAYLLSMTLREISRSLCVNLPPTLSSLVLSLISLANRLEKSLENLAIER